MRKTLLLLILFAFPFFASHSAKLPVDGGYAGPYMYYEDAGFGYLEGDALYDENVVTFDKNSEGGVFEINSTCAGLGFGSLVCCNYCASVSTTMLEYFACYDWVRTTTAGACAHDNSTTTTCSINCPARGALAEAEPDYVPCIVPIGGNVIILLIFALPYGIMRWRKRKNNLEPPIQQD